jgi:divalent metal cation (Fe/Co/Zn/Cd) transporter
MSMPSRNVIYAALVGDCLIAITKSVAFLMTGSSAMLLNGWRSIEIVSFDNSHIGRNIETN